ncbi:hypothetical protein WN51_03315 [Melipona quadrifasciata]|uniref:Uncharacterized protein n=1 Tax=Melipona quadrifasciata TaxID=166423 RepID=A0A0M8ZTY7_9HYME|nr:hypothetical protein WN51_03315 [Melipona quadrifasciata]
MIEAEAFFVDRFGLSFLSDSLSLSGEVTKSSRWELGKRLFGGHNLRDFSDESGDWQLLIKVGRDLGGENVAEEIEPSPRKHSAATVC